MARLLATPRGVGCGRLRLRWLCFFVRICLYKKHVPGNAYHVACHVTPLFVRGCVCTYLFACIINVYYVLVANPKSCRSRSGNASALRASRLAALFSTGGVFVCLFRYVPCPPASTSPGEGLPGGLLEGSCGRPKRRRMPNQRNIGMCARCHFKIRKRSHLLLSDGAEQCGLAEWRNGRRWARLLQRTRATRRASERQIGRGVLGDGRIRLVSEMLQAFFVRGNREEKSKFFLGALKTTYEGVRMFSDGFHVLFFIFFVHTGYSIYQYVDQSLLFTSTL